MDQSANSAGCWIKIIKHEYMKNQGIRKDAFFMKHTF